MARPPAPSTQIPSIPVLTDKFPCSGEMNSLFALICFPVRLDRAFVRKALTLLRDPAPANARRAGPPKDSLLYPACLMRQSAPERLRRRSGPSRLGAQGLSRVGASAPERGGHQLDSVLARPFGGAGKRSDLAAIGIDQERGRHADRPADRLQVLEHLGLGVGVVGEVADAGV